MKFRRSMLAVTAAVAGAVAAMAATLNISPHDFQRHIRLLGGWHEHAVTTSKIANDYFNNAILSRLLQQKLSPTVAPTPTPSQQPTEDFGPTLPFPFDRDGVLDVQTNVKRETSSVAFVLPSPGMMFYNDVIDRVWQNKNGHLTFSGPYSAPVSPVPRLPNRLIGRAILSAFWSHNEYHSERTNMFASVRVDQLNLDIANELVRQAHGGDPSFGASFVFVATWRDMAREGSPKDRTNTYQAALVTDGVTSYAILAYRKIEWWKHYRRRLLVGFSDSKGRSGLEVTNAANETDISELLEGTNCGHAGTFVYEVTSSILPPSIAPSLQPTFSGFEADEFLPFPYGVMMALNDTVAPKASYGGSNAHIKLPEPGMIFYSEPITRVVQNLNGFLTFTKRSSHWSSPPSPELPNKSIGRALLSLFWAGHSTWNGGDMYASLRTDLKTLVIAKDLVRGAEDGDPRFQPIFAVVATYKDVERRFDSDGMKNTYQVTLVTDGVRTWAILSYERVEWWDKRTIVGFNDVRARDGLLVAHFDSSLDVEAFVKGTNCFRSGTYVFDVTFASLPPSTAPSSSPTYDAFLAPEPLPFPFGPNVEDAPRDGRNEVSEPFLVNFTGMAFYNKPLQQIYQSNYGLLSFGVSPYRWSSWRREFPSRSIEQAVFALFWTWQDTQKGELWAGLRNSSSTLDVANELIRNADDGDPLFEATYAFVATFEDMGRIRDRRNTYQGALVTNGVSTWAVLSYERIEWWERHYNVRIGFSDETGRVGLELIGLQYESNVTTLLAGTNCGRGGTYVFDVTAEPLPPSTAPSSSPTFVVFQGGNLMAFPWKDGTNDTETIKNDDGSSRPFRIDGAMSFYGKPIESVFQNTNGFLTFGEGWDSQWGPEEPLPSRTVGRAVVALFWADHDTRSGGRMWASVRTDEKTLRIANELVDGTMGGASTFNAELAFVATWKSAERYNGRLSRDNTYQVALASDGESTWVFFSYERIEWFDPSVRIGITDDAGRAGFNLINLETDEDVRELVKGTNCGREGTYAFDVTNEALPPSIAPSFTPTFLSVISKKTLPFDYGDMIGDSQTFSTNDGSSKIFSLPSETVMYYFNIAINRVYQNVNGHLTFEGPYGSSWGPPELPEKKIGRAILALFWADHAQPGGVQGGKMWGAVRSDAKTLEVAGNLVGRVRPDTFNPTVAFVATYKDVQKFGSTDDRRTNTYQVALVSDGVDTYAVMSYEEVNWYDKYVLIGFNDITGRGGGTPTEFEILDLETVDGALALVEGTNCNRRGTYVYDVTSEILPPSIAPSWVPSSLPTITAMPSDFSMSFSLRG